MGWTSKNMLHKLWMFALHGIKAPVHGCISILTDTIDQGPELQIDVAPIIEGFVDAADGNLGCDV